MRRCRALSPRSTKIGSATAIYRRLFACSSSTASEIRYAKRADNLLWRNEESTARYTALAAGSVCPVLARLNDEKWLFRPVDNGGKIAVAMLRRRLKRIPCVLPSWL